MPDPSPSTLTQSKLQLPTARKKEWWPDTADSSPQAVTSQHCDTHYFSGPRTRNLPVVGWLLVRRATSSATDSPSHVLTYSLTMKSYHLQQREKQPIYFVVTWASYTRRPSIDPVRWHRLLSHIVAMTSPIDSRFSILTFDNLERDLTRGSTLQMFH